jgi:hypothetical protein
MVAEPSTNELPQHAASRGATLMKALKYGHDIDPLLASHFSREKGLGNSRVT